MQPFSISLTSVPAILRAALPAALVAFALNLGACKSAQGGAEGENAGPVKVELDCDASPPRLILTSRETGKKTEEGAVELPADKTCEQAEDLADRDLRKLPRVGEWLFYHENSTQIFYRGEFVAGKREGEFRFFDAEGRLNRTIQYANGEKTGLETGYFPGTQEWKERGQNAAGKRTGVWEFRAARDSDCISRGAFESNEKTGPWEECELSDQTRKYYLAFRGSYRNGLRDGPAQMLGSDGAIVAEGRFAADLSPECTANPPEGKKENCGKRTGQWKFYHAGGRLAMTGSYNPATGRRSGVWTEYYRSGEKMAEGPRDHTRNGRWTFYARNGQLIGQFNFEGNDFTPRAAVLYENGRKIGEGPIAVGLVKYDAEKDEIVLSTMVRTGQWTLYDANGARIGEGELVNSRKQGRWQELRQGRWQTVCYMIGRERPCD